MERNNSNNIESNFFIFGEGDDSKFLIHSSIMDIILRDSNFPSLPDDIKYEYLRNFLTQVAKKGFNDYLNKNGDSPIPLIYRDWSDYCVLNSSLKKKGSEDYILLFGLSILSIEEHAENVTKDKVFEKYNFLRRFWGNQMDMILNEMRNKKATYFIYEVGDNPHSNVRTELRIKGNVPPVDFFDKDICKIIINPSNFEIGTQANEVIRHILCRDPNERYRRLSKIDNSLRPQFRNGQPNYGKFVELFKNVLKDAEIRIKRNPRLAIPYGLNLKSQNIENAKNEIIVKGQFAIPLYKTCDDTRPFGGLTVSTRISVPKTNCYVNKKNRENGNGNNTEEDRIIRNAIEFSVCTYIFKTILTNNEILMDVLPYVNCDISYLWCNDIAEREQEE